MTREDGNRNVCQCPSSPARAVTVRHIAPLFLLASLLVGFAAGCSADQGIADPRGPVEDVDTGIESVGEESNVDETVPHEDANTVVTFPQHNAPLRTDNGGYYFAGKLVLDEGCLRVEVPPDANGPGGADLLIWPSGFTFAVEDGLVSVMDGNGRLAAHVSDHIRLSRATISYEEAHDQGLIRGTSEDCGGPYYLVGDEVSVFDLEDEPTELRLADPDIIFPRERTIIATGRERLTAAGSGELVLDGQCLRLKGGSTIIWPAGFEPHVEQGVVQVRNGAGRVIARVGDTIAGGGGYSSSGYGDCPGGTFGVHSIKVLPDVEVYFPKQDGTLGNGQETERYVGDLVLNGKCLVVDHAVRVRDNVIATGQQLLIWPDTFELDLDDEAPGIVDSSGRVVARVGDEVQFSAVSVSYQEAMDHSGLREISPVCSGGYWVVRVDFTAVADGDEGSAGGERASEADPRDGATAFPQHDAPPGTDNGGHFFAGRLVLDEGCLRAEIPPDANSPGVSVLPVWPSGFALHVEDDAVGIVDTEGEIAATVGDHVRFSSATISFEEAEEQGLLSGMSEDCDGPHFLVGDEVSVFDPNTEPTELRLSDPDVIFPRRKTIISTGRAYMEALATGELVLDGPCLRLKDGPTIVWPAGFEPHMDQGVVQVRNGAGRVIALVGDQLSMGGGHTGSDYGGCPGGVFQGHSIKVLPDVEVYFPKQDGTLGADQDMERYVGKLVLDGKCLVVDHAVRVRDNVIATGQQLLIWPDTFELDLDDEVPGVVDPAGRVVRAGDDVEFSAISVSYQDAMDHSGLREISPVCSGGYWVVGEDFAPSRHFVEGRKFPNRDLSNLTAHELEMICEVVSRPHFIMSSETELYFDKQGQLWFDINTGRTRDTWPYREALRQKCPSAQ